MSFDANKHFGAACVVAAKYDLKASKMTVDGDERIRLSYGGSKLANLRVDPNTALHWIAAFYPDATILTFEDQRIIISVGPAKRPGQDAPSKDGESSKP